MIHDASGWERRPDGSRVRRSNGIRITDRTTRRAAVEHLVTWQEAGDQMVVLGLDQHCRPVYVTTLAA
jgi:hypothetical protein